MLNNRFARAEGTGNAGSTTLCNGKKRVDNTLTCDHGINRGQLFAVRTCYTNRPLLNECDVLNSTILVFDFTDAVGNLKVTLAHFNNGSLCFGRNHDLVLDYVIFLNGTVNITGANLIAKLNRGNKVPYTVTVECGHVDATLQIGAKLKADLLQRTLDTVIDVGKKSGAKLNRQRCSRGNDLIAAADACGLLIYLNRCAVAVHFDDLTDQTLRAYAHNVEHICISHTLGNHKRSRDF